MASHIFLSSSEWLLVPDMVQKMLISWDFMELDGNQKSIQSEKALQVETPCRKESSEKNGQTCLSLQDDYSNHSLQLC